MQRLTFTVDSRLLRELGERLVGSPHIALAELVKNSYDADARHVLIRFTRGRIEVVDDGHGMTMKDFVDHWLRIGSTHKESQGSSRKYHRPLTGSKGVGRLSVQLLANSLEVRTTTSARRRREVVALVDWKEAVDAGLLTEAPVLVDERPPETSFAANSKTGTKLILTELNHKWTSQAFTDLAREIWPLQPPFRGHNLDPQSDFTVELESPFPGVVNAFNEQMRAVLDLWTARLVGEMIPADASAPTTPWPVQRPERDATPSKVDTGNDEDWDTASDFQESQPDIPGLPTRVVRLSLEHAGRPPQVVYYQLEKCLLDTLTFEIRVFTLHHRQPFGISVGEARKYLRRFGGVHVYDAGFHLPYYGPDADWLHIEIDHSHRLSRSRLLPKSLQEPDGQRFLPTNSRLFGVVNVNTTVEQRHIRAIDAGLAREALAIQVSRDRLAGTQAYRDLVTLVRWSLDYYAAREAARAFGEAERLRQVELRPAQRIERAEQLLEKYQGQLPERAQAELRGELRAVAKAASTDEQVQRARVGLLGALATAGISALSHEHEVAKQFRLLSRISVRLRRIASAPSPEIHELAEIADSLDLWLDRARATRGLFAHLLSEANRTKRDRFRAHDLIKEVARQLAPFARGTKVYVDHVPRDLRLPEGGFAEWTAVFQNLLINSFNATVQSPKPRIDVSGGAGEESWILLQDNGIGVDMEEAELLFEPFERRIDVAEERSAIGLGGSGLGLTIVRMISEELGAMVGFAIPDGEHSAAVRLSWRDVY